MILKSLFEILENTQLILSFIAFDFAKENKRIIDLELKLLADFCALAGGANKKDPFELLQGEFVAGENLRKNY